MLISGAAITSLLLTLAPEAALFDELESIYLDTSPSSGAEELRTDTPRGVPVGVHVLVAGLGDVDELRWELTLGGRGQPEATAFQMLDVPVEQNTGLDSRTEIWTGQDNPYVTREAPFRIFEALLPVGRAVAIGGLDVAAIRIEVPIEPEARPGRRAYTIRLRAGDWSAELRWAVRVLDVTVPELGPQSPGYTNWFSPGSLASWYGLDRWSEDHWALLDEQADLLARGRQSTLLVRMGDYFRVSDDGDMVLNADRLTRFLNVYLDRGFSCIEWGHIASENDGTLALSLTGEPVSTDEGEADTRAFLRLLREFIEAAELPDVTRHLIHVKDEPGDHLADPYLRFAELIHEELPMVPVFDAGDSRALAGAIDSWCPQVRALQTQAEFYDERRADGDRIWTYTCLVPGGQWLNRLLDQERLRQVYVGWGLVAQDLDGFLHWGLDRWSIVDDPYECSVIRHPAGSETNFLPAGDTHVIYPGPDGPISSQRFEAHRIGMEDAELLLELKRRDPETASRIARRVFRAFDDYETSVEAYRRARRALLMALSG